MLALMLLVLVVGIVAVAAEVFAIFAVAAVGAAVWLSCLLFLSLTSLTKGKQQTKHYNNNKNNSRLFRSKRFNKNKNNLRNGICANPDACAPLLANSFGCWRLCKVFVFLLVSTASTSDSYSSYVCLYISVQMFTTAAWMYACM